jgi:FixJ family two-component response regulator
LDVRLQGLSGLDFQTELTRTQIDIPIIFITGYGDVPMTVQAMKAGAVEFLTKPFSDDVLLSAIRTAIECSHAALAREGRNTGAPGKLRNSAVANAKSWHW